MATRLPSNPEPETTRPNAKPNKRTKSFHLLLTALLSGTVCYGLGSFAGCSSSWLASTEATYSSAFAPRQEEEEGADAHDPDDIEAHYGISRPQKADKGDRRTLRRTSLPYDCGVVFFYHIPSTGGASLWNWFKKYHDVAGFLPKNAYYECWEQAVRKDGSFHPSPRELERRFAAGMDKHIQNLGPNEWRVVHSHVTSTYLNESEDLLYKWRADVEAQGCQLINAVMFRDPLNHAMSLWKIIDHKNATAGEWLDHLKSPTGTGKWGTVLDFFLYNIHGLRDLDDYPDGPGGRNPFNVSKEVKVKRALELLHRHFDIVTVGNHAAFEDQLLNLTGWPFMKMLNRNRYLKELVFTKAEVESLQKLLVRNGDVEFIDRVKYEYHGYLAYLDN